MQTQHVSSGSKADQVLVTGSTGYVGGRLVSRLVENGFSVRCLVRDARKVASRPWFGLDEVEVVQGDAGDEPRLLAAMQGCDAAYYLIHSMIAKGSRYRDQDRRLAEVFARAAARARLKRIIYLGGLGETGTDLSEHLVSRREVEKALASGPVPLTVLRAAMIIGSGSASFEILRYLVERLPFMVTPRWVSTRCQPISIRDTLHYLVTCLRTPGTEGRTLDIGGRDVLTYREVMQIVARALGVRKRVIVPVPVLTPRLSSLWIHLVTPVSANIARPLADGLRNPVVCRNDEANRLMPTNLLSVADSITAALRTDGVEEWESAWTDAGVLPGDPVWAGGAVYEDSQSITVHASADDVFKAVCKVGGRYGWPDTDWLWRLRGWADRLIGGPGLARGRRRPERVVYGDVLDFWRVSHVEPGRCLELRAEMKLPGTATLEFSIGVRSDRTELVQIARFRPKGLPGVVYWSFVTPFHGLVFRRMLRAIGRRAEMAAQAKRSV